MHVEFSYNRIVNFTTFLSFLKMCVKIFSRFLVIFFYKKIEHLVEVSVLIFYFL